MLVTLTYILQAMQNSFLQGTLSLAICWLLSRISTPMHLSLNCLPLMLFWSLDLLYHMELTYSYICNCLHQLVFSSQVYNRKKRKNWKERWMKVRKLFSDKMEKHFVEIHHFMVMQVEHGLHKMWSEFYSVKINYTIWVKLYFLQNEHFS